jgi:hypothetical protein
MIFNLVLLHTTINTTKYMSHDDYTTINTTKCMSHDDYTTIDTTKYMSHDDYWPMSTIETVYNFDLIYLGTRYNIMW